MQRNRDPCTMLVECKMLTDTVENSLMATWKVKHGTTHCFKMLLRPYGQWLMPPHPQAWQKATPRVASKTYQQTSRHFTAKMTPFSTSAQCSKSDSCLQELSRTNQLHTHSSIAQLCPTLCDPMNRSTPGLPVHHQLPEFTETRPSSQWWHPAISFSVVPFSPCPQSLPASGSFPMSQLFLFLE